MSKTISARFEQYSSFFVVVLLLLYIGLVFARNLPNLPFIDFPSFWVAANLVVVEDVVPYGESFASHSASLRAEYTHPFVYPPSSLPLYSPLALFSLELAATLHLGFVALAACGCTVLIWAFARPYYQNKTQGFVALVGLSVFVLMAKHVNTIYFHGQVDLFVLLLALSALYLLEKRPKISGVCLAMAILIKPYAAILLLPLFIRGRYYTIIICVVVVGASSLASVLLFGPDLWQAWAQQMLYGDLMGTVFPVDNPYNTSIRGAVARLEVVPELGWAIMVALLIATFWATVKTSQSDSELCLFWLCLVALLPTVAWYFYSIYALPAAALISIIALRRRRPFAALLAAIVSLVLFYNPVDILWRESGNLALTVAVLILWGMMFEWMLQKPLKNP